jgi:hypothetical protein
MILKIVLKEFRIQERFSFDNVFLEYEDSFWKRRNIYLIMSALAQTNIEV